MTGNPRYANGSRRRALAARVRAKGEPCHICGLAIDYSLPAGHPLAPEVDELVPVSKGGSPFDAANVAAAHRCCNQWRGNRPLDHVARVRKMVADAYGAQPSALAFCECARAVAKGRGGRAATPIRKPKKSSGAL